MPAGTPLTPLAGRTGPNPSPLRRRGYFSEVHGASFSRVPSLFGRLDDRNKPLSGGAALPQVCVRRQKLDGCMPIPCPQRRRVPTTLLTWLHVGALRDASQC